MKNIIGILIASFLFSGCTALFNASLSKGQRAENLQKKVYVTNPENQPRNIAISLKNFEESSVEKDFIVNIRDKNGRLVMDDRFDLSNTFFGWINPEKRIDTTFTYQSVRNIQLPEEASHYGDTLYVFIWRLVKEPLSPTGGKRDVEVAKVALAIK